jgi:hypothetical protein
MLSDPSLVAMLRWVLEGLSLAALLAVCFYVLQQWSEIPARVPSHFDWRGRPDSWSGRWILFLMLAVLAALYVGMSVAGGTLQLIEGDVETNMREALTLGFTKLGAVLLTGYAIVTMVRVARGQAEKLQVLLIVVFAAAMSLPAILLSKS